MELAQAKLLIELPKFCDINLVWNDKSNQKSFLQASCNIDDEEGATIPGMTIQFEIKKPILVASHHFELGLFQLKKGVRERVFQLHVSPINRRSHNDKINPIYGPHKHHGCKVTVPINSNLDDDFTNAFALYCKEINLNFTGNLNSPI